MSRKLGLGEQWFRWSTLCFYLAHVGSIVLPRWTTQAHIFDLSFYCASELKKACFRQARVARACFHQVNCFILQPLQFLTSPPKPSSVRSHSWVFQKSYSDRFCVLLLVFFPFLHVSFAFAWCWHPYYATPVVFDSLYRFPPFLWQNEHFQALFVVFCYTGMNTLPVPNSLSVVCLAREGPLGCWER